MGGASRPGNLSLAAKTAHGSPIQTEGEGGVTGAGMGWDGGGDGGRGETSASQSSGQRGESGVGSGLGERSGGAEGGVEWGMEREPDWQTGAGGSVGTRQGV